MNELLEKALCSLGAGLVAPYFQYIFRPSGGIPNPNDQTGTARIGDAGVFGVTTTIRY